MKLSQFIRARTDDLLSEWESFARDIQPLPKTMTPEELRNRGRRVLETIADDMDRTVEGDDEAERLDGRRDDPSVPVRESARHHATQRLAHGFELKQMIAEYRALRATVVRRWIAGLDRVDGETIEQLGLFHEAVDQSLLKAAKRYSGELERARDLVVTVLAHDMRNGVASILAASDAVMGDIEARGTANARSAVVLHNSARRVLRLVDDLVDFGRTRLGDRLPVAPAALDLAELVPRVCAELQHRTPGGLVCDLSGNLSGVWDGVRMEQVLSDLLENAIRHGRPGGPVTLTAHGEDGEVVLAIHNEGPPIPEEKQRVIFEPLVRLSLENAGGHGDGIGLGLYIVRQIVEAHGGQIRLRSAAEGGTTVEVRLPRRPPEATPGGDGRAG